MKCQCPSDFSSPASCSGERKRIAFQPIRAAAETLTSESSMDTTIVTSQSGPFEEEFEDARIRFDQTKFPGNHYPSEVSEERKFFHEDLELFGRRIGQSVERESGRFQPADDPEAASIGPPRVSSQRSSNARIIGAYWGNRALWSATASLKERPRSNSFVPFPEIYYVEKISPSSAGRRRRIRDTNNAGSSPPERRRCRTPARTPVSGFCILVHPMNKTRNGRTCTLPRHERESRFRLFPRRGRFQTMGTEIQNPDYCSREAPVSENDYQWTFTSVPTEAQ